METIFFKTPRSHSFIRLTSASQFRQSSGHKCNVTTAAPSTLWHAWAIQDWAVVFHRLQVSLTDKLIAKYSSARRNIYRKSTSDMLRAVGGLGLVRLINLVFAVQTIQTLVHLPTNRPSPASSVRPAASGVRFQLAHLSVVACCTTSRMLPSTISSQSCLTIT